MMKKTLVAMAVLAASGASFAQVTITGDVEWGWASSHNGVTKADSSGFGVDTNELYIDAVEDLGGGMKIAAHMGLIGLGRNGESAGSSNVQGENTTLSLTGGFGKLDLQTTRNGDYLCGMAAESVAPCFDGNVWGARSYRDQVVYTSPELAAGLKAQFYWGEPNFQTAAANDGAIGVGQTGNSLQRKTIISAIYSAGALNANAGYISQDNRSGLVNGTSGTTGVRVGANYNLGVATVGAAYENDSYENGSSNDFIVNVNVPVSAALTLGVDFAQHKDSGRLNTADGTISGWGVGARYALSKSTAIWAQYKSYDGTVAQQAAGSERNTWTEIAIAKSF